MHLRSRNGSTLFQKLTFWTWKPPEAGAVEVVLGELDILFLHNTNNTKLYRHRALTSAVPSANQSLVLHPLITDSQSLHSKYTRVTNGWTSGHIRPVLRRRNVLVWSAKCCRAYDRMRCVGSLTEKCLHPGSQFQPPNTAIHIIGRRKQFVLVLFRWSAKMYRRYIRCWQCYITCNII